MSEFIKVGPEVPYGLVCTSMDDVIPVRDIALRELLDASRNPRINTNAAREIIRYSIYFRPLMDNDIDQQHSFISVSFRDDLELSSWRLLVAIRTFSIAEYRSSKRTCYSFETYEDQLFEAKKETQFVRGLNEFSVDDYGIHENLMTVRKSFEKPLMASDCASLLSLLQRSVNRRRASA